MEKKHYIVPDVKIAWLVTRELMAITNPSETPDDPNTPAPERKPKAF